MSSSAHSSWKAGPVIEWLLTDGRKQPNIEGTVFALGEKLNEIGAPVNRIRLSMRTLHPLITAYSAIWERGAEAAQTIQAPHGMEQRPAYHGSPMKRIRDTRKPFRKNLVSSLTDDDHVSLRELKERGTTDYYGLPLDYSGEMGGILVLTSDQEGGFTDDDIAQLNKIALVLSPIAELSNVSSTSRAIADAYLGSRTGELVLEGKITRGDIETIEAAIAVVDLRDWTGLSNRLEPAEALAVVNTYFELLARSVDAHGGEILKFVGDGILAIYPVDEAITPQAACSNAVLAANEALVSISQNETLANISFGQGLHFGKVLYGNVGAEERIDFTVLGEAVNRTARIEGLCKELGEPVLMSQEFADYLDQETKKVSTKPLKGFEGEFDIFKVAQ